MAQVQARSRGRSGGLDADRLRADFPMLSAKVHGKPLIYLDNAASTQKPASVIERLQRFYTAEYAKNNEEHILSENATKNMQTARERTAGLLGAESSDLVSFVRNATEALHVVADGLARAILQPDDEIVLSTLEHHSNIIPWLHACERTGAKIGVAPVGPEGDIDLEALGSILSRRTRIVSIS